MLTVNELFSGIGAFRKALINLKIAHEIVGISEIDKWAIKAYETLYGETRNYGDISQVQKLDYADLWTYGFPCQDISAEGLQAGIVKGQTRSGLLYEVQRLLLTSVLEDEAPKYLIMENVKNLLKGKHKAAFLGWCNWLDLIGYTTHYKVMNAADYGIPQNRERVIAVSIRKDLGVDFTFPDSIPLTITFRDLLEDQSRIDDRYYISNHSYELLSEQNAEQEAKGNGFRFVVVDREREQKSLEQLTRGLSEETAILSEKRCLKIGQINGLKHDRSSRIYSTSFLCPTLTAVRGGYQEVKIEDRSNVRRLTPREYWRLMGFTDEDFNKVQSAGLKDTHLYRLAGNSIVVPILEAVLKELICTDE